MAAKRKAKAQAKPPAAAQTAQGPASGSQQGKGPQISNEKFITAMNEAHSSIQTVDHLGQVAKSEPLSIKEGGFEAPFELASFKNAMGGNREYAAAYNLFSVDIMLGLSYPFNMTRIREFMELNLSKPCRFRWEVAVLADMDTGVPIHLLSPVEPLAALRLAIARDMKANRTAALDEWDK